MKEKKTSSDSIFEIYMKQVVKELPNLPSDIVYSFSLSHEKHIKELNEEKKKGPFCPNCACPWSFGCNRMRLWPPPRKQSAIVRMKKREGIKRISRKEKTLLSLAENNQNALVIKCKVCDYDMVNKFDLSQKDLTKKLKEEEEKTVDDMIISKKKKKKKKKNKEKNAGLFIPSELCSSKVETTNESSMKNKITDTNERIISNKRELENNCNIENEACKKLKKVNDVQILNKNDKLQSPQRSLSAIHISKVTNLDLSSCGPTKPSKLKNKKPSIGMRNKAMKVQNIAFLRGLENKRKTLSLESFLGSLI